MAEEPKKSGEILSFEQEIYMVVNGISTVGKLKFGESGMCALSPLELSCSMPKERTYHCLM
jgi:hypothetical protein